MLTRLLAVTMMFGVVDPPGHGEQPDDRLERIAGWNEASVLIGDVERTLTSDFRLMFSKSRPGRTATKSPALATAIAPPIVGNGFLRDPWGAAGLVTKLPGPARRRCASPPS